MLSNHVHFIFLSCVLCSICSLGYWYVGCSALFFDLTAFKYIEVDHCAWSAWVHCSLCGMWWTVAHAILVVTNWRASPKRYVRWVGMGTRGERTFVEQRIECGCKDGAQGKQGEPHTHYDSAYQNCSNSVQKLVWRLNMSPFEVQLVAPFPGLCTIFSIDLPL